MLLHYPQFCAEIRQCCGSRFRMVFCTVSRTWLRIDAIGRRWRSFVLRPSEMQVRCRYGRPVRGSRRRCSGNLRRRYRFLPASAPNGRETVFGISHFVWRAGIRFFLASVRMPFTPMKKTGASICLAFLRMALRMMAGKSA